MLILVHFSIHICLSITIQNGILSCNYLYRWLMHKKSCINMRVYKQLGNGSDCESELINVIKALQF